MGFLFNKYTIKYFKIIVPAIRSSRSKADAYFEIHHILPVSLGGGNHRANKVLLTAKEHFLCHLLLTKMTTGLHRSKMAYAYYRMKSGARTSKSYDFFKKSIAKHTTGENNAFFGRKHSERALMQMRGTNHHMFGKRHSAESRLRMSQSKIGRSSGGDNPMFGKKHTPEWRAEHSKKLSGSDHFNYGKPAFNKGRIWMTDGTISKMIMPVDVAAFVSLGWIIGRKLL